MFCVIRSAGFLPSAGVVHHFLACNVHVIDFCLFFFFFSLNAALLRGSFSWRPCHQHRRVLHARRHRPMTPTSRWFFFSCLGRTRSGGTFFLTCPDLLLSSRPCLLLLLLPPPPTPPPPPFVCLPFLTSQTTRNGVWPPPDKLSIRFFYFPSQQMCCVAYVSGRRPNIKLLCADGTLVWWLFPSSPPLSGPDERKMCGWYADRPTLCCCLFLLDKFVGFVSFWKNKKTDIPGYCTHRHTHLAPNGCERWEKCADHAQLISGRQK